MKKRPQAKNASRSYRQTARAEAAENTRRTILDSFLNRLRNAWFDEITLDAVAQDAGVTVQTVVRRFGGKAGLLAAVGHWMEEEVHVSRTLTDVTPASVAVAIARDYEEHGDLVMRFLEQEGRQPVLKPFCDQGRREHRAWLSETFAASLADANRTTRSERLDALVAATDLYLWKLLRRDLGRSVKVYQRTVERLIRGALVDLP